MRRVAALLLALLLPACGAEEAGWSPPPQRWQDLLVRVESRPPVPVAGMNEFLIIANHQRRGFINDLIVRIRTDHSQWRQAIPDGALGVYRRALPVADPRSEHLYVRLERNGRRGRLTFDLAPSPGR
ncbi:MAG: hypothetical protein D6682_08405 [Zetaproteobacteria bacterium]|nr:MAG: hypothetical protein D6682_08405 [Zetaproteobacteria bacterium]